MLNMFNLTGRISEEFKPGRLAGEKVYQVILSVPRDIKDDDGMYATDYVPVILSEVVAEKSLDYLHKGDICSIKGLIKTETFNGKRLVYLYAQSVSFVRRGGI